MKLLIEKIGNQAVVEAKQPGPELAAMICLAMEKYPLVGRTIAAASLAWMEGAINKKLFEELKSELSAIKEKN